MVWVWSIALAVLTGCGDDPLPPILAFEAGSTADLGPLRLAGPPEDLQLFVPDDQGRPREETDRVASDDIADAIVDDPVLDGQTAIRLGGELGTLAIEIERPELVGRRIEVRFWQRPAGTRVEAHLLWLVGDVPLQRHMGEPVALSRLAQEGEIVTLGSVDFVPTGRRTPQGWEEWTSGPVDHAFGGAAHLTPLLVLRDVAVDNAWKVRGPILAERIAFLDALQIVDVGPAAVPEQTCRLADEASRCGRHGACALGRCVDASARYGGFPSDDGIRAELAERRARELADWSGARQAREEVLDDSADAIRKLGRPRTTPRKWWLGLADAVRDLHDGHSTHGRSLARFGNGGLCLDLGVADLLRLDEPVPLVTHHFGTPPWDGVIELGDVLVEVDGEPAARWIEDHAEPLVGVSGSLGYRQISNATRSMYAAVSAGSMLTFERCPEPAVCEGAATRVEVDLAEAAAGIWADPAEIPPLLVPSPRACDHRLDPVVADDDARGRRTFAMGNRGPIPVLQLNGFSSPFVADDVAGAVEDRLVVDARAGTGGSLLAELALARLFTSDADMIGIRFDPWFERQPDETGLAACVQRGDWCFGSNLYTFDDANFAGAAGALRGADLVLLDHVAVSANDLFSLHVQLRCVAGQEGCGATTLIGGADTAGGYSPPLTGPAYLGDDYGAILTPYDTKLVYDETTASPYLIGSPVTMDVQILQTQSDAIFGVDTQLEAALEAIR